MFWGAIDGACLTMSMDDAVVEGTIVLRAPAMAAIRFAFVELFPFDQALSAAATGSTALFAL